MQIGFQILLFLVATSATCARAAEDSATKLPSELLQLIESGNNAAAIELFTQKPNLIQAHVVDNRPHRPPVAPIQTDGFTPLHIAVAQGNAALARWLLEHGADANASAAYKTKDGDTGGFDQTPLETAIDSGQLELVKILIEAKARVKGSSELHRALLNRKREIAAYLLEHGCKHDLFSAAAMGEVNVLKQMLEQHPDLKARAERGYTALHLAAMNGQKQAAKLLLDAGANLNAEEDSITVHGDTPLLEAILNGHSELARYFIEAGADITLGGQDAPLHAAVLKGDALTLQALFKRKANLEQRDLEGRTALMVAVVLKKGDLAAALLENGADPNAKEGQNYLPNGPGEASEFTALDYAVQAKNKALCELLLHHGAKLNKESKETLKDVLAQPTTEPGLIRQ